MSLSKELREADVTITYDQESDEYVLTSSINPRLVYVGATRHKVLSNFQLDTPGYRMWIRETVEKYRRKNEETA